MYFQMIISILALLVMAAGLYGVFHLILKQNATLGIRAAQFLAIVFVLPLLIVLGINNVLGRETIGTILGVVVGYVLTGNWKE